MGPPSSRKKGASAKKKWNRKYRLATKHTATDIDQVHEELVKRGRFAGEEQDQETEEEKPEFDPDLPGGGLYYCVETARHFISQDALDKHKRSKQFKQRVKALKEGDPYTQDVAEAALGIKKEASTQSVAAMVVEDL